MKKYLNFSYHWVNKIFDPNPLKVSLQLKLKYIYLYQWLKQEGVKLIYMDEFAVQGNMNWNYSWGKRGEEINVRVQPWEKTKHCCVALSEDGVEGLKI